jgi:hypothetical protein
MDDLARVNIGGCDGQLDVCDYDDCRRDGRHALNALYPQPPNGSSEKGLSLQERRVREGYIDGKIFAEGEQELCGKRLQVEFTG